MDMWPIAHRGFVVDHTENTLHSMLDAHNVGCFGIEVDVRMNAQGSYLLMHDDDVSRTTRQTGRISQMSNSETADLVTTCGAKVPTLYDAMQWAANHNERLSLDLKGDGWNPTSMSRIDDIARSTGALEKISVWSGHQDDLVEMGQIIDRPRTWICPTVPCPSEVKVEQISLDAENITPDVMAKFAEVNVKVVGRRTNSRADWDHLHSLGVNTVMVDNLRDFRDWERDLHAGRR